jgi:arabinofuranosyltransferase
MVFAMSTERLRWLLLGVAAIAVVVHSLVYNFITDDAYISFVYARNFAEHGELVFNLGQYVEGYTNFLWTLLLGVGMLVDIPPELTAKILGAVFAVVTLFVTCTTVDRALGRKTLWGVVPALLLAASSGYACWTSGGLETQLFTMLCAIALDGIVAAEDTYSAGRGEAVPLYRGREAGMYRAGIALALAAMTRPEGLLVAAVLGIARLVCNRIARRRIIGMPDLFAVILFVSLWAPWFAWRWWYYGYLFPNTYYVKASGTWAQPDMAKEMYSHGAYYVWAWLVQTKLLYVLPVTGIGLMAARPRTPRFALGLASALLAAVYLPYAISVGGDFMGLHRFIMPMFVVAAIAVTLGLEWVTTRFPERARLYAGIAIVVAVLGGYAFTQIQLTRKSVEGGNFRADKGIIDTPAFLIVYTEDRATIGKAMASCFTESDFSIVGGAGAQPYYAHMRAIDVFGLVSARIAHEEPRIRARAGHTKFASDTLLAQYDPTFVFSCYAIHASPTPPGLSCNTSFWAARGYEQVTMKIPGLKQSGEYYTFLAKKARNFQCPGRVQ